MSVLQFNGEAFRALLKRGAKKAKVQITKYRRMMAVECDTTEQSIYLWENGSVPNGRNVCRIAGFLGVDIGSLFTSLKKEVKS